VPYALEADVASSARSVEGGIGNLIQSGAHNANIADTPGFPLGQGTGERTFSVRVVFSKPFAKVPNVVVGISALDTTGNPASDRIVVWATDPDTAGFTLSYRTWSDSAVWGVASQWLAYVP
jgi:hypothetical protein